MKFTHSFLFFGILFLGASASLLCLPVNAQICSQEKPSAFQSKYSADNEAVKKRTAKLFLNADDKSFSAIDSAFLNAKILPYLAPYLEDENEIVRQKAVKFIGLTKSSDALSLLALSLEDKSENVQNAAARTLYDNYKRETLSANSDVENALCRSLENGSNSAAAFLIFSYYVENPQTEKLIIFRGSEKNEAETTLYPLIKPVEVSFLIKMVHSEIGGRTPRSEFRQAISSATLDELAFLVWTMRDLGDPDLLHDLRKTLSDNRKMSYKNKQGVTVDRRLRDLAVEKFVQRLNLKPKFKVINGKTYSNAETKAINELIYYSIPQS